MKRILSSLVLQIGLLVAMIAMSVSFVSAQTSPTIVDIAAGDPNFSTLVTALNAAGLTTTLDDPDAGPFTVFAPTNVAFANLPDDVLNGLLADPMGDLTETLLYHVVSGALASTDIGTSTSLTTLNGDTISVRQYNNGFLLNESVYISVVDIVASNGVIHVIDDVLIYPAPPPTPTILALTEDAGLTTLEQALNIAGLGTLLDDPLEGPFTVFAPTNQAFASVTPGTLTPDVLGDILQYHVVEGLLDADTLSGLTSITTVTGEEISIELLTGSNNMLILNGESVVTIADNKALNGIVHVIDSVLFVPPPTCADLVIDNPNFSTLKAALDIVGLTSTLADPNSGSFTIFAPTNDAFDALPDGTVEELLANPSALGEILTYHVITETLSSGDVAAAETLTTLEGRDIDVAVIFGSSTFIVLNGEATVTQGDIEGANCTIHVIDTVLTPPLPPTIATIIMEQTDILEEALEVAGLAETLADPEAGPFTIFAPSDAAFQALEDGTLDGLLANPTELASLLQYHVIVGELTTAEIIAAGELSTLTTLDGDTINVRVNDDGTIVLNDSVTLQITDIQTENGIVHIIDLVLNPLGPSAVTVSQSSVDIGSVALVITVAVFAMMGVATVSVRKSN